MLGRSAGGAFHLPTMWGARPAALFTSPPCGEVGPRRLAPRAGWGESFTQNEPEMLSPPHHVGRSARGAFHLPTMWGARPAALFTSPPCGEVGPRRLAPRAGWGESLTQNAPDTLS